MSSHIYSSTESVPFVLEGFITMIFVLPVEKNFLLFQVLKTVVRPVEGYW